MKTAILCFNSDVLVVDRALALCNWPVPAGRLMRKLGACGRRIGRRAAPPAGIMWPPAGLEFGYSRPQVNF